MVCLLPARNAAADLPGYFESVRRFADHVIALDDGSEDETAELLADEPLVTTLLSNPVRTTYAGWDDAANRRRLLEAADLMRPDWVLWLDADERIDASDAAALRHFIDTEAVRGDAYLFRWHRMIDDLGHYDKANLWVGRLFAWEDGLQLPTERLHPVPIPISIPHSRWRRTTFRIQHLGSLDTERRRARVAKYLEADPGRSYEHLLAPPVRLWSWWARSPQLPVIAHQPAPAPPSRVDAPALSAVVIAQNDADVIESSVRAVVTQDVSEPFEVIVVCSGTDATAALVRKRFPDVTLVELDHPALPGEARNAGLERARGTYVSFPGSHIDLVPGSLERRLRAHRAGYAMVTGSLMNGTPTRSGWASYFLDNAPTLPGRPAGPLTSTPIRCSYLRSALIEAGGFPEDMRAGEDTVINEELFSRGYGAFQDPDLHLIHRTPCRNPKRLATHHFHRGVALGTILVDDAYKVGCFPTRRILRHIVVYPAKRLAYIVTKVRREGGPVRRQLPSALPLIVVGIVSAWLGSCTEMVRAMPRAMRDLPISLRRGSR